MNGYEYTRQLMAKIDESPTHTLDLKDAIAFISFYGLRHLFNAEGNIGFVGQVAIDVLDKAITYNEIWTTITNTESIDRWINAKEKKPNPYEDVLVLFEYENYGRDFATSLKIGVAYHAMGRWYGDDLYKYPKSNVIYWQPR